MLADRTCFVSVIRLRTEDHHRIFRFRMYLHIIYLRVGRHLCFFALLQVVGYTVSRNYVRKKKKTVRPLLLKTDRFFFYFRKHNGILRYVCIVFIVLFWTIYNICSFFNIYFLIFLPSFCFLFLCGHRAMFRKQARTLSAV